MTCTDRYRKLYAGVIYDAMYYDLGYRGRFVINRGVTMLAGDPPMVGPAFTCWGTRPSAFNEHASLSDHLDTARLEIFAAMQSGEVVVMDTDRDGTIAHFGDVTAQVMQQAGIVGAVLDGYTRDLGRIRSMGFSLFARGAQPQDAYGKWGLLRHGDSVQFETTGGNRIVINPGDWIFGDADGVLVIPRKLVTEVLDLAEARHAREQEIRAALKTETPAEVYWRMGRW